MIDWLRIRHWIIKTFEEQPPSKTSELVWLEKTLKTGETINWSFVDTVDYNIDSIPRNKELVIEFQGSSQEAKRWLSSLNSRKEHLPKKAKNTITQ